MEREAIAQLKARSGTYPYEKRLSRWTQSSNEYRAWCPWHEQDHSGNPSLCIYQDKSSGAWLFKCMAGCKDKCGDVFKFIQLIDGCNFGEALRRVAADIGFKEPEAKPFQYDHADAEDTLRANVNAMSYLASRGIDDAMARQAHIGLINHYEIGLALAIPYGDGFVKFRALTPTDKSKKFRHVKGKPTHDLLYGINDTGEFDSCIYVTESELDSLMMRVHGYSAVSVSSATTCLGKDGKLIIKPELLAKLEAFEKIILVLDQDDAGRSCAAAFKELFPRWRLVEVKWDYEKSDGLEPKDIGEVYANSPEDFRYNLDQLVEEAINRPPDWRLQLRSLGELDSRGVQMLVKGFMPEGTVFIGALPGGYKTFFGLSLAHALCTQQQFLGTFDVPKKVPVIYLCPESGGAAFQARLIKMGIPNDPKWFLCRTLTEGKTLLLNDPLIIEAVRAMNPVVILDTAVRFSQADDENDSIDNQQLVNDIIALRQEGARAVIGLHHSKKSMVTDDMNLDNVLRGTGDLSAMCDAVYGLKRDEHLFEKGFGPSHILVECIKPRDFEPPKPFMIAATYRDDKGLLRSNFDENHDFKYVANARLTTTAQARTDHREQKDDHLATILREHPEWSRNRIAKEIKISRNDVEKRAADIGFILNGHDVWVEEGLFPTCQPTDNLAVSPDPY